MEQWCPELNCVRFVGNMKSRTVALEVGIISVCLDAWVCFEYFLVCFEYFGCGWGVLGGCFEGFDSISSMVCVFVCFARVLSSGVFRCVFRVSLGAFGTMIYVCACVPWFEC